jgi:hypothetical protein
MDDSRLLDIVQGVQKERWFKLTFWLIKDLAVGHDKFQRNEIKRISVKGCTS